MSRNVQLVLLCEDAQHEAFARRFLGKMGWSTRRIRVEKGAGRGGAGEQFVRERFPKELSVYRSRRHIVEQRLIVMMDGDREGVDGRLRQLLNECKRQSVTPLQRDDRVGIFVPTWRIETWFAYFDGNDVDEAKKDYRELSRERDCQRYVNSLVDMCVARQLRSPVPSSLVAACSEFNDRIES